jgi:hypothetical protein
MKWDTKVFLVVIVISEMCCVTGIAISPVAGRRTKHTAVAMLLYVSEFGDKTRFLWVSLCSHLHLPPFPQFLLLSLQPGKAVARPCDTHYVPVKKSGNKAS